MSESKKVIKLREPIQFGSETISELEVRKPKAKDLRPMPTDMQTTHILDLAGSLCAQPKTVIDELCIEDTLELLDVVGNFIKPGRPIGNKT